MFGLDKHLLVSDFCHTDTLTQYLYIPVASTNQKNSMTAHYMLNHVQAFLEHAQVALPSIGRLALQTAIHHFYHKGVHNGCHVAGHKFHWLGKLLHKWWITDLVLILALMAFGAVTEHEPAGEHHSE